MSAERVEQAIAAIARRDPELARWAENAAGGMTAGEGEEVVDQASLQQFLWYYLPKKYSNDWTEVAGGAAALFDELGMTRYAAIARSETTASILSAWRTRRSDGFRRFKAAHAASGVQPPDTALFVWGDVFGVEEANALGHVERELEHAIVDGRLKPGARDWKAAQAAICDQALTRTIPGVPTQSWLTLAVTERVKTWIDGSRSDHMRAWRQGIANGILSPPALPHPGDVQRSTEPLRWLLQACSNGVLLTASGYLPVDLMREAVDRFGWHEVGAPPHSEADVHRLAELRLWAMKRGWLRRRGKKLTTSPEGKRLLLSDEHRWRAVTANLGDAQEFEGFVCEVIAHRLLEGPSRDHALDRIATDEAAAAGWRADKALISLRQMESAVAGRLYYWRLFGLLDEEHPKWIEGRSVGQYVTALTPIGRAAAVALLHARATGPRRGL